MTATQQSNPPTSLSSKLSSGSSTAASTDAESPPHRKESKAEELADRLIAFSRRGSAEGGRANPLPPPPPILKRGGSAGGAVSTIPPPSPRARPTRRSSSDLDEAASAFFESARSAETDLHASSASLHLHDYKRESIDADFGSSAASLNRFSKDRSSSSRSLNRSTASLDCPRRVKITQFDDDRPPPRIESVESLPPNVDRKGRCVHHPSVRLYKRQLLGGYALVLDKCQLCGVADLLDEGPTAFGAGRPQIVVQRSLSASRCGSRGRERRTSREVYVRASSAERRAAGRRNGDSPPSVGKAASESEAQRVADGSAFSEEKPGPAAAVDRRGSAGGGRALSENGVGARPASSPFLEENPRPAVAAGRRGSANGGKALSENGMDTRSGISAFLDDKPQLVAPNNLQYKYMDTGTSFKPARPSLRGGRSTSPSRPSSLKGVEGSSSPVGHKVRKAASESNARPSPDSPFLNDDDWKNTSMLERGLEKLSLLNGKRTASRSRGDSRDRAEPTGGGGRRFDKTGRCKKHPSILLARKKPFSKGWDRIRDSCPFCEEAGSEASAAKAGRPPGASKDRPSERKEREDRGSGFVSTGSDAEGPSRDGARRRTGGEGADEPPTAPLRGTSARGSRERIADKTPPEGSRVHKMPYTAPWGEAGWYTGEVDGDGRPHGQGRMRVKTGNAYDGLWTNGYSEQYLEKHSRIKGGFGSNIAPWKQNATSPRYESFHHEAKTSPSPRYEQSSSLMMQAHLMPPPPLQYGGQMPRSRGPQWGGQAYPAESAPQYWHQGSNGAAAAMYGQLPSYGRYEQESID